MLTYLFSGSGSRCSSRDSRSRLVDRSGGHVSSLVYDRPSVNMQPSNDKKKTYVVNHLGVNIEFRLVDNKWRKGGLRNTKQHVNNGPNVERHIYSVRKVIVT